MAWTLPSMRRMPWAALVLFSLAAPGRGAESLPDDFLQRRGTDFYLHGKLFYEISFNKFDLFWQILADEMQTKGFGTQPLARAEKALQDLHQRGFKTIRVFCNTSPVFSLTQPRFFKAMDRMFDLCDRYDLRLVVSLGNAERTYAASCHEEYSDFICNTESKSRQKMRQYVSAVVTRYRQRKTVALWEHSNELLLISDIGGKDGRWNNIKVPTLEQVAKFHSDEAAFIATLDKSHPITTGDSYRNTVWHGAQAGKGKTVNRWEVDSMDQLAEAVGMAQQGVDVFCLHNYISSLRFGWHAVTGPDGQQIPLDLGAWTAIAHKAGKPLYVGEFSVLPKPRTGEKYAKFWQENPDWFESYQGPDSAKAHQIIAKGLETLVAAKPNLAHWWTFQSDRDMDQNKADRFDIDTQRNAALVKLVVEANRQLQLQTMGFTYMAP